ncbi:hypothetical protein SSBG_06020 [Streptomyces sp. SPB074]|nr:hypothetical protein SSBG_06020 [Streptomyces sp. SPB074]
MAREERGGGRQREHGPRRGRGIAVRREGGEEREGRQAVERRGPGERHGVPRTDEEAGPERVRGRPQDRVGDEGDGEEEDGDESRPVVADAAEGTASGLGVGAQRRHEEQRAAPDEAEHGGAGGPQHRVQNLPPRAEPYRECGQRVGPPVRCPHAGGDGEGRERRYSGAARSAARGTGRRRARK